MTRRKFCNILVVRANLWRMYLKTETVQDVQYTRFNSMRESRGRVKIPAIKLDSIFSCVLLKETTSKRSSGSW